MNLVFAIGIEAAQPIEALEPGPRICRFRMNRHGAERHNVAVHDLELGRISILDTWELEEVAQSEPVAVDLHSCHSFEKRDLFRLEKIRPADKHTTGPVEQSRFTRCHRGRQQLVAQLLHVARGMHVENHQIADDPLEPPVVMASEQLSDTRHSNRALYCGEKYRPVPRYAERPQCLLSKSVFFDSALCRPESGVRKHQMASEILI